MWLYWLKPPTKFISYDAQEQQMCTSEGEKMCLLMRCDEGGGHQAEMQL